jgi:hypothetical protein
METRFYFLWQRYRLCARQFTAPERGVRPAVRD